MTGTSDLWRSMLIVSTGGAIGGSIYRFFVYLIAMNPSSSSVKGANGKRRRLLEVSLDFATSHKLRLSQVYGGDDGARTRDLCRDS
jgi:hypothetical protein